MVNILQTPISNFFWSTWYFSFNWSIYHWRNILSLNHSIDVHSYSSILFVMAKILSSTLFEILPASLSWCNNYSLLHRPLGSKKFWLFGGCFAEPPLKTPRCDNKWVNQIGQKFFPMTLYLRAGHHITFYQEYPTEFFYLPTYRRWFCILSTYLNRHLSIQKIFITISQNQWNTTTCHKHIIRNENKLFGK